MPRPMEERVTKEIDEGKRDPSGFIAQRTYDTPRERMAELTLLPRTITMPLASLEMQEQEIREIIDHQIFKANIREDGTFIDKDDKDYFTMEYILPTEILRQSFYQHNRSIDGEHLAAGRDIISDEIASRELDAEEPHNQ